MYFPVHYHVIFLRTHQYFSRAWSSFVSLPSCSPLTRKLPNTNCDFFVALWLSISLITWGCDVRMVVSYWSSAFNGRLDLKSKFCFSDLVWNQIPECQHGVVVPRHGVQHFHVLLSSLVRISSMDGGYKSRVTFVVSGQLSAPSLHVWLPDKK